MQVTIAILSTMITMLGFLIIVSICLFKKYIKKGWIKIENPSKKDTDVIISELDEMCKEQTKENVYLQKQLDLALELYDEANKKLPKEEQI